MILLCFFVLFLTSGVLCDGIFLNEKRDSNTTVELSKLSVAVTAVDNLRDTERLSASKNYVLRRCNQTNQVLFGEFYQDTSLNNCHKIGEGEFGEVFSYHNGDGRARVIKIMKLNKMMQKNFHDIMSEIVIAVALSALRDPIADINLQFDEGKDIDAIELTGVENATDVFNEVFAVRWVYGPYPSELLHQWNIYAERKGSNNGNPAMLPKDQQYIVLELANDGQSLKNYVFDNAEQAYASFQQIAFGLAVGEEAMQFEHRDLHWENVLIAPTEQKYGSFVIRRNLYRVPYLGVRTSIIDYSLSRAHCRGPACTLQQPIYHNMFADEVQVYSQMRDKLGPRWNEYEPYTNILWLHYTVDKMITAVRYERTEMKVHKLYIEKLERIRDRILGYSSATSYVRTDHDIEIYRTTNKL